MNDRIKPGAGSKGKPRPAVLLADGEARWITAYRHSLLNSGFVPLPTHGKFPLTKGWNAGIPSHADIDGWLDPHASRAKQPSTSVIIQGRLLAIDIDVPEPALVQQIMQHLYRIAPQLAGAVPAPVRGRDGSPKLAIFALRAEADDQFVMRSDSFAKEEGGVADYKVEVWSTERGLSRGQFLRFFVIDGPHTITPEGMVTSSYRWEGPGNEPPALGDRPLAELPVVTKAQMAEVIEMASRVLREAGLFKVEKKATLSGPPVPLYDITPDMTFVRGGVTYSYAELVDLAEAEEDLRVSGGFTGTGTGTRDDRVIVHFAREEGERYVFLFDTRDYTMHYPAGFDKRPQRDKQAAMLPPEITRAIAKAGLAYDAPDEDDQPVPAEEANSHSLMPSKVVEEESPPAEVEYVPPASMPLDVADMRASGYGEGFVAAFIAPLLARHFRYLWKDDVWLACQSGIWVRTSGGAVAEAVVSALEPEFTSRRQQAERIEDERDRERRLEVLTKLRNQVHSARFSSALQAKLKVQETLLASREQFDTDAWLMGAPGGLVIDLRTQKTRPAQPEDMLTRMVACAPADEANCPQFVRFLDYVCGEQAADLKPFLRRFFGRAMVGDTAMRRFLYIHGDGMNGKSILIETVGRLLGSYARPANGMFVTNRYGKRDTRKLIFDLDGVRYGYSGEAGKGEVWDDAFLKGVVSGDMLSERRMHENTGSDLRPIVTLAFAGNNLPKLGYNDPAIRTRMMTVEFENTLDDSWENVTLKDRLPAEEGPGIMRWLLDGLADYERGGLREPASVRAETEAYMMSEDAVSPLLPKVLEFTKDSTDRVDKAEVRARVKAWLPAEERASVTDRDIAKAIRRLWPQVEEWSHRTRGLANRKGNGKDYWVGVRLSTRPAETN